MSERNNLPCKAGALYLAPAEHFDLRYLFAFTKIVLVLEILSLLLIMLLPLRLGGADKGKTFSDVNTTHNQTHLIAVTTGNLIQ